MCGRIISTYPVSLKQKSRDNFLSYLLLQNMNINQYDQQLIGAGFSPLNHCESHTLSNLELILNHLGISQFPKTNLTKPSQSVANKLKKKHAVELFGKGRKGQDATIMVTLDRGMLKDKDLFIELLRNGMDIARINCAHDDQQIWEALISALHQAEIKLAKSDLEGVRQSCKIYMDLAGPKIRIGKFQQKSQTIKIPASKNASYPKPIGYIDSEAEISRKTKKGIDGISFILSVPKNINFLDFQEGDEFIFSDIQNHERTFRIMNIISATKVLVELNQTAYITEKTVLKLKSHLFHVLAIPSAPVKINVKKGDCLRIVYDLNLLGRPKTSATPAIIATNLPKAFYNAKIGDHVFIDDGVIQGTVIKCHQDYIELEIISSPNNVIKIKEGQGINLPDSLVGAGVPAITKQDIENLPFILNHADMIGISFIHSPADLQKLQYFLDVLHGKPVGVVAKIETKDAVHNLGRIILEGLKFESFGIMIARGDLAVEIGFENLAIIQEEIIQMCRAAHLPVIWATQVLEKLTKEGIPTRAEISDVFLGKRTQCIMLNKGPFIIEAVKLLANLLKTVPCNCLLLNE
jgi:pyruvate kinase